MLAILQSFASHRCLNYDTLITRTMVGRSQKRRIHAREYFVLFVVADGSFFCGRSNLFLVQLLPSAFRIQFNQKIILKKHSNEKKKFGGKVAKSIEID